MIVYCCNDLIFAVKIRSTADSLGVVTRPARDSTMLDARLNRVDDGKPNGAVTAFLVDLDCGEQGVELVRHARARDATLPVIAFGAHVATAMLDAARDAGASVVMPRGAFTAKLPTILRQYG